MEHHLLCSAKYSVRGVSFVILYLSMQMQSEVLDDVPIIFRGNYISYLLFIAALYLTTFNQSPLVTQVTLVSQHTHTFKNYKTLTSPLLTRLL